MYLDISHFNVVGVSGGGPYALTCAYQMPERLTKAAAVSSPAPFNAINPDAPSLTLEQIETEAIDFARQINENPAKVVDLWVENMLQADRQFIQQTNAKAYFIQNWTEAFRGGAEGYICDEVLIGGRSWGFALAEIQVETHIWHGETDTTVPVQIGRYLSEHIPNARLHLLAETGHLIPEAAWEDIFASLQ